MSEKRSTERSERLADLLDLLFIKRGCGWCGQVNLRGTGFQVGHRRWCNEEHAELDFETAA